MATFTKSLEQAISQAFKFATEKKTSVCNFRAFAACFNRRNRCS